LAEDAIKAAIADWRKHRAEPPAPVVAKKAEEA